MKSKTRKLLGRFIALLIILVLSVFSCAKAPIEDSTVVTENNIPPENNTEKTGEKTDSPTENAEDLDPETVVNNDKLLQTDVQQEYKPLEFELEDDFWPYDVVVTLTAEESAKGKDYKVEDFAGFDIFHVFEYSEYYSKEYYPQLEKNRTFVLMLSEPSKERVLEYCKELEKDSRVQFARPNISGYGGGSRAFDVNYQDCAVIAVTLISDANSVYATDFANCDLHRLYYPQSNGSFEYSGTIKDNDTDVIVYLELKGSPNDYLYMKEQIKSAKQSEIARSVRPLYQQVYNGKIISDCEPYYSPAVMKTDFDYL